MKTTLIHVPKLSGNLFGVHLSGCQSRSNTLKCGHRTAALLLIAAALTTGSLLLLCTPSAHAQGGVPLWTNLFRGAGNANAAHAIATDGSGNLFVTGAASPTGAFSDYSTIKYSNEGMPLWTNYYDGLGNYEDYPAGIVVDGDGNVLVTGRSGPFDSSDYATIKYSNAGIALWTNRFNGPGNSRDDARAIAMDNAGNVFVTGLSFSRSGDFASADYATIKYSNAGVPLWTNRYNGPGNGADQPTGIAVDSSGSVFVLGQSWGATSFDYATIKYSASGVPLWTNRYNGPANDTDWPNAIAVDGNGNVFVTGGARASNSGKDYVTIKYSNAGVALWVNRYNGPTNSDDWATAIALDGTGNVFVTGTSQVDNYLNRDYVTIAYSNAGVPLWTNRYDGPTHNSDLPTAIAVDRGGNVFVTGGSTIDSIVNPAIVDYATVAYSNSGQPLWETRYNGPDDLISSATAITLDYSGNVFVTGQSGNGGNAADYVTIKYSSSLPPPVHLDFQTLNNELVLSWTNAGFSLQTAPALTGPFTNLPTATSPYTNPLTAPQQFFRLISN
jgi:hypothetical protein